MSVAFPQREPFICRLVTSALSSTGLQYTTLISTAAISTNVVVASGTYAPARKGKFNGIGGGDAVECSFSVALSASASTPSTSLTFQARNSGGTWVTLGSTAAIATAVTEATVAYSGYVATGENFNAVPFDWRVLMQTNNASNNTIGRLTNASYIRGEFEPGT